MRAVFSTRNKGISLIELLVAISILSLISLAAFKVLAEGLRYMRVNQLAIDSQRAGLSIMSGLNNGISGTESALIDSSPDGIVFASPINLDGKVEFDIAEQELLWQKWVCYYYDGTELTIRERPITPPVIDPGTPPNPSGFGSDPVRKVLSQDVSVFRCTQISTVPPVWSLELTVGDMSNTELYGMELYSEVGPRN